MLGCFSVYSAISEIRNARDSLVKIFKGNDFPLQIK